MPHPHPEFSQNWKHSAPSTVPHDSVSFLDPSHLPVSSPHSRPTLHPNFYYCWSNWHPLHNFIQFTGKNEQQNTRRTACVLRCGVWNSQVVGSVLPPTNIVIRISVLKTQFPCLWSGKLSVLRPRKVGIQEGFNEGKSQIGQRQEVTCLERRQVQIPVRCRKGCTV